MNEDEVLKKINKMCEQSLDPSLFEKWIEIKKALIRNRKYLKHVKITNE